MECVILAGGRGVRMRPLTDRLPKTLIPVGGVPFAHHQLTWLGEQGVRHVVYSIGYMGDLIRKYVGDGSRWGLSVTYVDEGADPRGTAGALRLAFDSGALPPTFLLLYGDSYLPIALAPVWRAFEEQRRPALMTVLRNAGRWDSSNVRFRHGVVELYDKRRSAPDMTFIDYGLSALQVSVVDSLVPSGTFVDLGDVFYELSVEGMLAGYEVKQRFYEVGSVAGLNDLEKHLADPANRRVDLGSTASDAEEHS
jgi:MurNAc alpha-1-phosphate uridylyltransferase